MQKSRASKCPSRGGQPTLGKTKGKNKNRIFDRIVSHLKTLSISELEQAASAPRVPWASYGARRAPAIGAPSVPNLPWRTRVPNETRGVRGRSE
jgi:hypothetical protein